MDNSIYKKNDALSETQIKFGLDKGLIHKNVFCYEEIGSTNEHAKILANQGFEEGTIVVSKSQTDGRGRQGRKWQSTKDVGLYMSIILKPSISVNDISQITLIAGIAVCNSLLKSTDLKPMIKWPNDIIINKKKVCGILTELNSNSNKINYLITGIGININNTFFDDDIKNKATSLFIESNIIYSINNIATSVLNEFWLLYEKFKIHKFDYFMDYYKSLCLNINKKVVSSDSILRGTAIDIKNDGSLVIKLDDGGTVSVSSGEVSLLFDGCYI